MCCLGSRAGENCPIVIAIIKMGIFVSVRVTYCANRLHLKWEVALQRNVISREMKHTAANTVLLEASIYTRADVHISLAVLRHPRV